MGIWLEPQVRPGGPSRSRQEPPDAPTQDPGTARVDSVIDPFITYEHVHRRLRCKERIAKNKGNSGQSCGFPHPGAQEEGGSPVPKSPSQMGPRQSHTGLVGGSCGKGRLASPGWRLLRAPRGVGGLWAQGPMPLLTGISEDWGHLEGEAGRERAAVTVPTPASSGQDWHLLRTKLRISEDSESKGMSCRTRGQPAAVSRGWDCCAQRLRGQAEGAVVSNTR